LMKKYSKSGVNWCAFVVDKLCVSNDVTSKNID
jgi:hypothetical protein